MILRGTRALLGAASWTHNHHLNVNWLMLDGRNDYDKKTKCVAILKHVSAL
jgi:hypothetical protein